MSRSLVPGHDHNGLRVILVATTPLWIGAVKRAVRRPRPGEPLQVEQLGQLAEVPPPPRGGSHLVLAEVTRETVPQVVQWLSSRRTLAPRWRLVALVRQAETDFSPQELETASQWLREAGASSVLTTIWELPKLFDLAHRLLAKNLRNDPWASLPLPLESEGWQPDGCGDRF